MYNKKKLDFVDEKIALKQAKKRAMAILQRLDKTEEEMRSKLKQAGYEEAAIDGAVEYVKSYHYIDDERYAHDYINYKKKVKSIRQISVELGRKGISKELINQVLEEENCNDQVALVRAIRKKTQDIDSLSKEEKQKLAASLYRKGFRQDDIRNYISF
jgi:regulatory protein